MRPVHVGHVAVVALAVLLAGCAGDAVPTPADTGTPNPSLTVAPSTSAPPDPPLAADLTGGTPLQLGSSGHWAIADGHAFVATDEGGVVALDLATGSTLWQAGFSLGEPWDAQPTLGVTADRTTVIATRTVDADGAPALDLIRLDAASGAMLSEHLVTDPDGQWTIDLPPRILAADAATIVLDDNPESGRQTAVIDATTGTLAWQVHDEAVAATADTVITRGAGWSRTDGSRLWQSTAPLGLLLAQSADALIVRSESVGVWLDPATGAQPATTGELGEADSPCAVTADTLICLEAGVTGYDLSSADVLWTASDPAEAVTTLAGWVYLWQADGSGDVRDARTGEVLVEDAELPAIRYSDDHGVLLSAENGYRWVPLAR